MRPTPPKTLSPREREVLQHVLSGHSSKAIGAALFIAPKTVETHRTHINRKLKASTPVALMLLAVSRGWLFSPSPSTYEVQLPDEVRL